MLVGCYRAIFTKQNVYIQVFQGIRILFISTVFKKKNRVIVLYGMWREEKKKSPVRGRVPDLCSIIQVKMYMLPFKKNTNDGLFHRQLIKV